MDKDKKIYLYIPSKCTKAPETAIFEVELATEKLFRRWVDAYFKLAKKYKAWKIAKPPMPTEIYFKLEINFQNPVDLRIRNIGTGFMVDRVFFPMCIGGGCYNYDILISPSDREIKKGESLIVKRVSDIVIKADMPIVVSTLGTLEVRAKPPYARIIIYTK